MFKPNISILYLTTYLSVQRLNISKILRYRKLIKSPFSVLILLFLSWKNVLLQCLAAWNQINIALSLSSPRGSPRIAATLICDWWNSFVSASSPNFKYGKFRRRQLPRSGWGGGKADRILNLHPTDLKPWTIMGADVFGSKESCVYTDLYG